MIKIIIFTLLLVIPLQSAEFDTLSYCKYYLINHLVNSETKHDLNEISIILSHIEEVMNYKEDPFSIVNIYNNGNLAIFNISVKLKEIPTPHYSTDISFYFGIYTSYKYMNESFCVDANNILDFLNYYKPEIKSKDQFAKAIKLLSNFVLKDESLLMDSINDESFRLIKEELNLHRVGDITQDGENFFYTQYEKLKSDNTATYYMNLYSYKKNVFNIEKILIYKVVERN